VEKKGGISKEAGQGKKALSDSWERTGCTLTKNIRRPRGKVGKAVSSRMGAAKRKNSGQKGMRLQDERRKTTEFEKEEAVVRELPSRGECLPAGTYSKRPGKKERRLDARKKKWRKMKKRVHGPLEGKKKAPYELFSVVTFQQAEK